MFRKILGEVQRWVAAHEDALNAREARIFLRRWPLCWEEELFAVQAPNRLRYLSFLLRQNHLYRFVQTWKFTLLNYLSAFPLFVCGYRRARSFHDLRLRLIEALSHKTVC